MLHQLTFVNVNAALITKDNKKATVFQFHFVLLSLIQYFYKSEQAKKEQASGLTRATLLEESENRTFQKAPTESTGTRPSSPSGNLPVIAAWDSFFCRLCRYLRMVGVASGPRSRKRRQHCPQSHKNQRLQECLLLMFKSCGKRRFNPGYTIDPFGQAVSRVERSEKSFLVSNTYVVVVSSQKNTISCGSRRSSKNFNVHNLFIRHFSGSHFSHFFN